MQSDLKFRIVFDSILLKKLSNIIMQTTKTFSLNIWKNVGKISFVWVVADLIKGGLISESFSYLQKMSGALWIYL